MAKTNPYNSRQTAALAFDEEQADGHERSLVPIPARSRSRAWPDDRDSRAGGDTRGDTRDRPIDRDPSERRPRRRTPVHHGFWTAHRWSAFLLRTRSGRVVLAFALLAACVLLFLAYRTVRDFLEHDPHFRIDSSASIQIDGNTQLTRPDLLGVFGGDIGRNIFFVPLARRQAELERVPWVAHATVMRLLPDELRVSIIERVPVAFVRLGSSVELIDASGIVLHLPPAALASRHYSFPVVTGFAATDTAEVRAERMQLYQRFVAALDAPAGTQAAITTEADAPADPQPASPVKISSQISEVDLSDLEDVRAVVPAAGTDILLHFGDTDFLPRYRSYQAHLAEWRQQYPHLAAVDLRYDRQVVLKMSDGAVDEASSVDHGNSLTPAPTPAPRAPARLPHHPTPPHTIHTALHPVAKHMAAHPAAHPAGHGTAHGWRPQ